MSPKCFSEQVLSPNCTVGPEECRIKGQVVGWWRRDGSNIVFLQYIMPLHSPCCSYMYFHITSIKFGFKRTPILIICGGDLTQFISMFVALTRVDYNLRAWEKLVL